MASITFLNQNLSGHQVPDSIYLWFSIPILLLNFFLNTWAAVVTKKKDENVMNDMIIWDCISKIFIFALILLIYGSPFSVHGISPLAQVLCGVRSFFTSLLIRH